MWGNIYSNLFSLDLLFAITDASTLPKNRKVDAYMKFS